MEGCVKASHLWHIRHSLDSQVDWSQVMRLVQRRERDQFFELGKNLGVHEHRLKVFYSPKNNPVPHTRKAHPYRVRTKKGAQVVQRAVMAEFQAFAPGFFIDNGAVRGLGKEVRRSKKRFHLAPER